MQITLGSLFGTPVHHYFAAQPPQAHFLAMNREAYRRSIFVDARIAPASPELIALPLPVLLEHATQRRPQRIGWIFHVAQCGSTLLARGIDRGAANLVLREPMPLRQLGVEGAAGQRGADWAARLDLALMMAGRRYDPALPTIVKATVPVNFILDRIAATDADAPAIFLYFPLEAYLVAVLRSPKHRQWVERVTDELAPALAPEAGAVAALTNCERAAALWLAQMRAFVAAMEAMPASRSLEAGTFFGAPREALAAASALFGRPMTGSELDAVLAGDLFTTYSKNPAIAFDNRARIAREAENARLLAPEIARARGWIAARVSARPLVERLPRPLCGANPPLL